MRFILSIVCVLACACSPGPQPGGLLEAFAEPSRAVPPLGEGVTERVTVIGASASKGFLLPIGLADALGVLLGSARGSVSDCSSSGLFFAPLRQGSRQVERALATDPTLVVGVDFLFWFGYGLVAEEEDRLGLLDHGIALLERFDCPLVVGRFPDMTPAVGRMLMPGQMPDEETLAALNVRLEAWAEERGRVLLVPLDRLLDAMRADEPIVVGDDWLPAGSTQALLQADQLHPSFEGEVVMALLVVDALRTAGVDVGEDARFESAVGRLREFVR